MALGPKATKAEDGLTILKGPHDMPWLCQMPSRIPPRQSLSVQEKDIAASDNNVGKLGSFDWHLSRPGGT